MELSHFLLKRFGVCLVLFLLFSLAGFAATYSVPANYSTIQAAINAADPNNNIGTVIIVLPGTYFENINFKGKDIILTSTDPEDPNVVAATIIDGNGIASVVTFDGDETSECVLRGFTITNGIAGQEDGGGICGNHTHATIENCIITGNMAEYGGGLHSCDGLITNCSINNNAVEYSGGGLCYSHATISNCSINNNAANSDGGGLDQCYGLIINCLVNNNTAGWGGGLHFCDGVIVNCTIADNVVTGQGGGLNDCDGTITNCIIWGNVALGYGAQTVVSSTPSYSCIQGWTNGSGGNIVFDPDAGDPNDFMFVDAANGDYHLVPGSPCIDTGTSFSPGGLPATDIEGFPRPCDGDGDGFSFADMGAYEYHALNPEKPFVHVFPQQLIFSAFEASNNPATQGMEITNRGSQTLNWSLDLSNKPDWLMVTPTSGSLSPNESELLTLSVDTTDITDGRYHYMFDVVDPAAINSPQTIMVIKGNIYVDDDAPYGPGPYDPNLSMDGSAEHPFDTIQKGIDAAIVDGDTVIVLPGTYQENINYNGKNIILTSTDPDNAAVVESTIIDGGHNDNVVTFVGNEWPDCILRGFKITNGYAYHGGGINGNWTHATIANCTITGNLAYDSSDGGRGGGLYRCHGLITQCTITGNTADGYYNYNYVSGYSSGGGLAYCDGIISSCKISDNSAGHSGGGLAGCDCTITNCTVAGNSAVYNGGGFYHCDIIITNCTVADNSAVYDGGGFYGCCERSTKNCIIWGNVAGRYGDQFRAGVSYNPSYNCIQGSWTGGTGNINSNPLFADAASGDYHLKSEYDRWDPNSYQWVTDTVTSPCIDAGDPASDWTEELWPHGERINMGAYGGTAQASMSANPVGNVADLDHNDEVGILDLMLFSEDWLYQEYLLDTDLNRNGVVDIADFADFARQWLWGF